MAYEYPQAGKHAQPEVKKAVERFHRLPDREKERQALWTWLLGDSTQKYKMSKHDAGFVNHPVDGMQCSLCRFAYYSVYDKKYVCSQMAGQIFPDSFCGLFQG